jgi:hypothetical protein
MQRRKTISVKERTHSRATKLVDGFDDSLDKLINRLIDEHYVHLKGKE